MKLQEVMSRNVQVIPPDATLFEAAQNMKELDVGGLPVCADDRLQGFVTDRDIVVRGIAEGKNPQDCKVSEVMSPDIHWCYEEDDVKEAGQKMESKKIRRLLVLDKDKKLVGIFSLGDLARAQSRQLSGEVLQQVSEPTPSEQPTV